MTFTRALSLPSLVLSVALAGCAGDPPAPDATEAVDVHAAFLANLGAACCQAFAGTVTTAPEENQGFVPGSGLVMHVRACSADEVSIPVWAGDNGSRTWVFTRTAGGVDLRHDHRHADGRSEPTTFYGAFVSEPPVALEPPSANRHEFKRISDQGLNAGWVVEIVPGERYTYGTQRDGQWRHRFDFDLTAPVEAPGDPWGHAPAGTVAALPAAQEAFWANLSQHCGQAYAGRVVQVPEGNQTFSGSESLIVHFRECGDGRLALPFHADDDHSRTWVFTRTTAGIDLRHDHRLDSGVPDPQSTWYGAHTQAEGAAGRQEFLLEEPRDGAVVGWRVEIVPHERYTYGTVRDGAWVFRADFDLTAPVAAPAAPWGH